MNYFELRFVENAHSTEGESRSVCGKCSFHRDDVILENAHSTETKLLMMILWKTLIPPRRNLAMLLWETLILLIIIRKVFVENAYSTERHVSKIDTLYQLMDFVWTVYEDLQEI